MIETQWQKDALAARREARDMFKAGWEWVGGDLWKLYRGSRTDEHIVDAKVGKNGLGLWVRIEKRNPAPISPENQDNTST